MQGRTDTRKGVPPSDETAEQAILACMLMDKQAASVSIELLKEDDFYNRYNGMVFAAAADIFLAEKPVDMVTLKNKLEEKGQFEQIGGIQFLISISTSVGSSVNVKHYIDIVKDKSDRRKLIRQMGAIVKKSYEPNTTVDEIMGNAEQSVSEIMQNRHSEQFHHISEVAVTAVEKIQEICQTKGGLTGIGTGFVDFDAKTAGLQRSDLILLAARPSMGKTAFAMNIAQNAAIRGKIPTAIFSLEMSREQLVNRILCSEAMIDAQKLRTGELDEKDWDMIIQTVGPVSDAPIYIDDTPGVTPMEIRSKCRRLKAEKGLGLVVIDYLQLMSGDGRTESRQQEISEISRSLKALAREIDAPVLALSQLSRACEMRADHRPMLSDLRESGAIEQDADVVAFLYRDEYYFPDSEKQGQAELIIAKQRNGPTGTVELSWLGQYTKFGNLVKRF